MAKKKAKSNAFKDLKAMIRKSYAYYKEKY
jgi:hypothetical protein